MRPVNLIPGDQRRTGQAALGASQLSYALIAGLVLVLGAVTILVLTGNKISDHKSEIATLQARKTAADQRAQEFQPYTDFASLEQTRQATVTQLAQSRFDWERVLRELAIVIPGDVWLTSLNGSVSSDSAAASGSSGAGADSLSSGVTGPTLTISGCATDERAVASFLAALRDIDGVTRVGLQSTTRSDAASASGGSSSGTTASGGGGACSGTRSLESFEALAAFDAVQIPDLSTASSTALATPAASTTSTTSTTSTAPTTSTTPGSTTSTTPSSTTPSTGSTTTPATSAPGGSN